MWVTARAPSDSLLTTLTATPLAATPNSANETATNAKWYHIVTEKIRVSRISSARVLAPIRLMAPRGTDF
jgi:hypothetical protein